MGWLSGMNKMCDLSNQPGHWMNGELKSGMNETAREQWFHRGRWSARAVRNETSKLLMGHFAVQHTTKSLDKYVGPGHCTSMNCSFICSFFPFGMLQCIVVCEHSSLHWEGSGALAASFPLLIGPPVLRHHLVLHHPPVLHHHLVGFKCTSQDFVGRTVVFSEKWKAKQYQMTFYCHISIFFSMTLSRKRSSSHPSELYFWRQNRQS